MVLVAGFAVGAAMASVEIKSAAKPVKMAGFRDTKITDYDLARKIVDAREIEARLAVVDAVCVDGFAMKSVDGE